MRIPAIRRARAAALALSAVALLAAYGLFVEPSMLRVRHLDMRTGKCPRLRVALLSDLHEPNPIIRKSRQVLEALDRERPDLLLIAGDCRQHFSPTDAWRAFLRAAARNRPVVAVMGNADMCGVQGQCLYCALRFGGRAEPADTGFRILRNETWTAPRWNLKVLGMDDPVTGFADRRVLDSLDPGRFNLLLVHSTHALSAGDLSRPDLTFAGHTHGGQIRCLRPFLRWYGDQVDRRWLAGDFRVGPSRLIVSAGVGTSFLPVRIGVPPELLILDIHP